MVSSSKDINKKIKIGVNIRIYETKPSGIQNFIRGLFTELLKENKKYHFIFFSTGKKKIEQTAEYITASSKILDFFNAINPLIVNIFFDNIYIMRLIFAKKLDIFIGPSYIVPLIKPRNVKYVAVIYDLSYLTYKHNPFNLYLNFVMYMKCVIPLILKRADRIIVPSSYVKNEIRNKYHTNINKIDVIYGGKDDFYYKVNNKEEFEKIKKDFNISKDYCFTNATNHERKNIYGLIDAFLKIDKFSEYQLIITGLLPESAIVELKDYIYTRNVDEKVKYLGFVTKEELRILYSYAKVFIFPSFEEGFGFPVLEAASCGCLPICSDTGSLPEVIGNKELLFNPRDINSITQKINDVLLLTNSDYAAKLKLVQKHTKKFTWEKAAREHNKLFKMLISKNI